MWTRGERRSWSWTELRGRRVLLFRTFSLEIWPYDVLHLVEKYEIDICFKDYRSRSVLNIEEHLGGRKNKSLLLKYYSCFLLDIWKNKYLGYACITGWTGLRRLLFPLQDGSEPSLFYKAAEELQHLLADAEDFFPVCGGCCVLGQQTEGDGCQHTT